jgi:hypothetical protein
VLVDARGARIVADGLCYTNEAMLSADGAWLYVNETFGRRLLRFRVGADGAFSPITTFATGPSRRPRSIPKWITSIVSNRVLRVAPDGRRPVLGDGIRRAASRHLAGGRRTDRAAGSRLVFEPGLATDLGPQVCLLGDAMRLPRAADSGRGITSIEWAQTPLVSWQQRNGPVADFCSISHAT